MRALLFRLVVLYVYNARLFDAASSELSFRLFVGHKVNLTMTTEAVRRTTELGTENIIVIDTSFTQEATRHQPLQQLGVRVLDPMVPLTHTGMQEFMRRFAIKEHLDAYFWVHSDVYLAPGTARAGLKALKWIQGRKPDTWGMLFFQFDWFAAFSTHAVQRVGPWDLSIPLYKADLDYYNRMLTNGFQCYGENSVLSSRALPVPTELKDAWPKSSNIDHIGHGSAVYRAMQRHNNQAASGFSLQEQWSMWMEDYIGRYVYFPLKWGYANQDMASDTPFETTTASPWLSAITIFLLLPAPSANQTLLWWILKLYIALAAVILPVQLCCLFGDRWRRRTDGLVLPLKKST